MGGARSRIEALTGIRAIAALAVVAFHFNAEFDVLIPGWRHLQWLVLQGGFGVDLFFLLSGFILTHNYAEKFKPPARPSNLRFIWLRLARIYPAYVAALLGATVVMLAARFLGLPYRAEAYPPDLYLPELFMVHAWFGTVRFGWNYPDWSVSAEWFAYLFVFPLGMTLLHRVTHPVTRLLMVILPVVALSYGVHPASLLSASVWKVSYLFLAGCFLRGLWGRVSDVQWWSRGGDFAAVVFCLVAFGLRSLADQQWRVCLILCALASLILALGSARGPVVRLLSLPTMIYLGEISYSLYLSHGIVHRCLKVALPVRLAEGGPLVHLGVAFGYAACILGAAMLLYHGVEKPGREWMRRLGERTAAGPRAQQNGSAVEPGA